MNKFFLHIQVKLGTRETLTIKKYSERTYFFILRTFILLVCSKIDLYKNLQIKNTSVKALACSYERQKY